MTTEEKKKTKPTCYTCGVEVIFDKNRLSPRGIQIPLNPDTRQPHECQSILKQQEEKEKEKEKERQTELSKQNEQKIKATNGEKHDTVQGFPIAEKSEQPVKAEYVDHTLARPSEVKIFYDSDPDKLAAEYKEFQIGKKFAWSRAQFNTIANRTEMKYPFLFSIAFYYELAK